MGYKENTQNFPQSLSKESGARLFLGQREWLFPEKESRGQKGDSPQPTGIKKVTPNREVEGDNIYNLMLGKRDYSAMQITTRFSSFTLKG